MKNLLPPPLSLFRLLSPMAFFPLFYLWCNQKTRVPKDWPAALLAREIERKGRRFCFFWYVNLSRRKGVSDDQKIKCIRYYVTVWFCGRNLFVLCRKCTRSFVIRKKASINFVEEDLLELFMRHLGMWNVWNALELRLRVSQWVNISEQQFVARTTLLSLHRFLFWVKWPSWWMLFGRIRRPVIESSRWFRRLEVTGGICNALESSRLENCWSTILNGVHAFYERGCGTPRFDGTTLHFSFSFFCEMKMYFNGDTFSFFLFNQSTLKSLYLKSTLLLFDTFCFSNRDFWSRISEIY